MKAYMIAIPLLALGACNQAGDATINASEADADMVFETENAAAMGEVEAMTPDVPGPEGNTAE